MSDKDHAIQALYPAEGRRAMNVRYFPGTEQGVTEEQLAKELARAHAQITSGSLKPIQNLDEGLTNTEE